MTAFTACPTVSTLPSSHTASAQEVIAMAVAQGLTLRLSSDGTKLRAFPTEAVTREVADLVRPVRAEIIELLRTNPELGEPSEPSAKSVSSPAEAAGAASGISLDHIMEGQILRKSPDYCPTCGNPDFYVTPGGWRCAFCVPRVVAHYYPALAPPIPDTNRPAPKLTSCDPRPWVPFAVVGRRNYERTVTTSWFDLDELCYFWPEGWVPPHPIGEAASTVASMNPAERRRRAASWAEQLARTEWIASHPEHRSIPNLQDAYLGRNAIVARQAADVKDAGLVDASFEDTGYPMDFVSDYEEDY